jgi:hypothetical protein
MTDTLFDPATVCEHRWRRTASGPVCRYCGTRAAPEVDDSTQENPER